MLQNVLFFFPSSWVHLKSVGWCEPNRLISSFSSALMSRMEYLINNLLCSFWTHSYAQHYTNQNFCGIWLKQQSLWWRKHQTQQKHMVWYLTLPHLKVGVVNLLFVCILRPPYHYYYYCLTITINTKTKKLSIVFYPIS